MKSKQLAKALHDMAEEGLVQVLRPITDPRPHRRRGSAPCSWTCSSSRLDEGIWRADPL